MLSPKKYFLQCESLSAERGELELFSGLDLTISAKDMVYLMGPNGCGKTTLLRMLAGLMLPSSGSVCRAGSLLYFGHRIGLKAQLSALENLSWYHPQLSSHQLYEALAYWELSGYEDQHTAFLSAGQRQRVALCRLSLSRDDLWLLDEPFTAIDQHGTDLLEECFSRHIERGGAIVFTSHQAPSPALFHRLVGHELVLSTYRPRHAYGELAP